MGVYGMRLHILRVGLHEIWRLGAHAEVFRLLLFRSLREIEGPVMSVRSSMTITLLFVRNDMSVIDERRDTGIEEERGGTVAVRFIRLVGPWQSGLT
jgi:hypothetical protein